MKRSIGFKLLFIGCLLFLGPFALTEFLGINLSAFQILVSASEGFGLLLAATGIMIIYYKGKRKR